MKNKHSVSNDDPVTEERSSSEREREQCVVRHLVWRCYCSPSTADALPGRPFPDSTGEVRNPRAYRRKRKSRLLIDNTRLEERYSEQRMRYWPRASDWMSVVPESRTLVRSLCQSAFGLTIHDFPPLLRRC